MFPIRSKVPRQRLAALLLSSALCFSASAAYVTDSIKLELLDAPSADGEPSGRVNAGEQVRELERRGDFVKLRTGDGEEGWLEARYLSATPVGATRERELESLNEALNAELRSLRSEVDRLKTDLLDSEEIRKRQIHAISRSAESQVSALKRELEALRVVRAARDSEGEQAVTAAAELGRLREELRRLNARNANPSANRIPSDTLREMERLAQESRAAKERLAQAESRARRLARAAQAPAPAPDTVLNTWQWAGLALSALVLFALGVMWADFRTRKRHGGYRI